MVVVLTYQHPIMDMPKNLLDKKSSVVHTNLIQAFMGPQTSADQCYHGRGDNHSVTHSPPNLPSLSSTPEVLSGSCSSSASFYFSAATIIVGYSPTAAIIED